MDPLFFPSPSEAVETISRLLTEGAFKELARYYHLEGSSISPEELTSGRFFRREERPEAAHPGDFWRWRHPFPPGFEYHFDLDQEDGTVVVFVWIEIDQGEGMTQVGKSAFKMRRTADGLQVLPQTVDFVPDPGVGESV